MTDAQAVVAPRLSRNLRHELHWAAEADAPVSKNSFQAADCRRERRGDVRAPSNSGGGGCGCRDAAPNEEALMSAAPKSVGRSRKSAERPCGPRRRMGQVEMGERERKDQPRHRSAEQSPKAQEA